MFSTRRHLSISYFYLLGSNRHLSIISFSLFSLRRHLSVILFYIKGSNRHLPIASFCLLRKNFHLEINNLLSLLRSYTHKILWRFVIVQLLAYRSFYIFHKLIYYFLFVGRFVVYHTDFPVWEWLTEA